MEFIVFDKSEGVKAYLQLASKLKGREFDLLLHMQVSLRASIASLLIKAPVRIGFDSARARNGQHLFTNQQIAPVRNQHVLDGFLEFPKLLGINNLKLEWDIPIPIDSHRVFENLPAGRKFLAINPCTSSRARNFRNWSIENYAKIIDYASDNFGLATVLTGGPTTQEKEYAEKITAAAKQKPVNLVGKTNLKELLAVLEKADIMISPDTGPAHLAGTVGTPVIGLYASSNPLRTGPYQSLEITVSRYPEAIKKEFGKAVSEVRWGQRVRTPDVMSMISLNEVIEKLKQVAQK